MLRFLFSEERASHRENECWCGAANQTLAAREAKRGFLFQFCTTPGSRSRPAKRLFIRAKSLIRLA
jgi:hypothetical protein